MHKIIILQVVTYGCETVSLAGRKDINYEYLKTKCSERYCDTGMK
jgi:hypothetical protein